MTGQHLRGAADMPIPPAAEAMYEQAPELAMAEAPEVIEWTDERQNAVIRQFRDMDKLWWFAGEADSVWDDALPVEINGKIVLKGNCNAWAPMLLRRLLVVPGDLFPRGALRLTLCRVDGEGHMVLAITTTESTLIICPIVKMWSLGKPALRLHDWIAWEGHGGTWEGLQPVSLADLLKKGNQA